MYIYDYAKKHWGFSLAEVIEHASMPYRDEPNQEEGLVMAIVYADRWADLRVLQKHEKYGKEATEEYNIHQSLKKMRLDWHKKIAAYPEILKKWHRVLRRTMRIPPYSCGNYDVSYPCCAAQRAGLGDNYVAVTGDGMFLFMFEVVSLDGDGLFRFKHLDNDKPSSSGEAFLRASETKEGDTITGTQVLEVLRQWRRSTAPSLV